MYMYGHPPHVPLPNGIIHRATKNTNHCLAPTDEIVQKYLMNPTQENWSIYETKYFDLLELRFKNRRKEFDELAKLATENDVYIGCFCPTKKNPDVYRCHTVLAIMDWLKYFKCGNNIDENEIHYSINLHKEVF